MALFIMYNSHTTRGKQEGIPKTSWNYTQAKKIQNMLYNMGRCNITTHYKFYKLVKLSKQ